MAATLTLAAAAGGDADIPGAPGGARRLPVDEGSTVTLTCSAAGGAPVTGQQWTFTAEGAAAARQAEYDGKSEVVVTAGPQTFGAYIVTAMVGADSVTSNELTLAKPTIDRVGGGENGGAGDPAAQPVEVAVGEWDGVFAYVTLAILSFFALALIAIAYSVVVRIVLPDSAVLFVTAPADVYVDGRWSARVEALVLVLAISVAVLLLAFGSWLAALEARGRLRRASGARGTPVVGGERGLVGTVTTETITALTGLVKELRTVRGTIAVLIVGGTLLAGSLVFAFVSASSDRPAAPPPTPTPSVSSTLTPVAPTPATQTPVAQTPVSTPVAQ